MWDNIQQTTLYRYRLPFKKEMNFKGVKISVREGLILEFKDKQNTLHYSEIAPLINFSQETLLEATDEIITLLENGVASLHENKISRCSASVQFALTSFLINPSRLSASFTNKPKSF
jgi:O-succinylbenzoate synthase